MSEEEASFSYDDLKQLAITTPYSIEYLQEMAKFFENQVKLIEIEPSRSTSLLLFKAALKKANAEAVGIHTAIEHTTAEFKKQQKLKAPKVFKCLSCCGGSFNCLFLFELYYCGAYCHVVRFIILI